MTFEMFVRGMKRYAYTGYERGYSEGFARAEQIARTEGFSDRQGMLVADLHAMRDGSIALERDVEAAILKAARDYEAVLVPRDRGG